MSTPRKTLVFGPAYLDRVVRVDRPLIDPEFGGVVDGSASGELVFDVTEWRGDADRAEFDDWTVLGSQTAWIPGLHPNAPVGDIHLSGLPSGDLSIAAPEGWPGPFGAIVLDRNVRRGFAADAPRPVRHLKGVAWHDDLGGMGAGFAKAFDGTLNLVIGDDSDPINRTILGLIQSAGIDVNPLVVPGRPGEWTLLVTSGEFGDKLPIGFRAPVPTVPYPILETPIDLLVAASMTNARADLALRSRDARVRMFAPAIRNMTDHAPRVSRVARSVDILCCNRTEWEALDDREEVAWRVSILSVTDGPRGAEIRYTTPTGDAGRIELPAFPRRHPPRDTNRAGEAFASTLVMTLLDAGWSPGVTDDDLIRTAALRASAAAALVLDRLDFGFPTDLEIDRAVMAGVV